jgi:hypothetical protein
MAVVLALAIVPVLNAAAGWPLSARIVFAALLIAPLGFFMGMPFPRGLAALERTHPEAIRWAWALNAAASVFGSAAAIFCALYLGLTWTVLVGAACYLVAGLQPAARFKPPAVAETNVRAAS